MRWLHGFKNNVRHEIQKKYADEKPVSLKGRLKQLLQKLLKNIYYYSLYCLRYKVGLYAPKKGRPQTIVVIAKKI